LFLKSTKKERKKNLEISRINLSCQSVVFKTILAEKWLGSSSEMSTGCNWSLGEVLKQK
jgi:hypothetical protein